MSTSYVPYQPNQQYLMRCTLQEWLPQGHLAYFISDTVDSLNLNAFHARYAGGGSRNQPFHPAMLVKVLIYAYATGVFSLRKIAKKLHEDVAFWSCPDSTDGLKVLDLLGIFNQIDLAVAVN